MKTIKEVFINYKDTAFDTQVEINFWNRFLDWAIEQYPKTYPQQINRVINQSVFTVYNIDPFSNSGTLKSLSSIKEMNTNKLDEYRHTFFEWIMNMGMVRMYNALEVLLLRAIWLKCFTLSNDPIINRRAENKIRSEIKDYLINTDKTNNRDIIAFIETYSPQFKVFLEQPVRTDIKTTWKDFFEMVSIIRQVNVHNQMVVSDNIYNALNKHDLFRRYFELRTTELKMKVLSPIQSTGNFSNFLHYFNDFGLNAIKFLFNEKDFLFIGIN